MLRLCQFTQFLSVFLIFFAANLATHAQDLGVPLSTGLIFESEEKLRSYPLSKVYRNYVPPRRDLTKYVPLPGNQGKNGSCVGWAVAYAARTQHFVWDNKTNRSSAQNIASPAALYNSMYGIRENCEKGSVYSVALDFMRENGVPSVKDFPLNKSGRCQRVMSGAHYQQSKRFKIKGWSKVYPRYGGSDSKEKMITRIRDQVSQYRPVVVSIHVPTGKFGYSSFRFRGIYSNGKYEKSPSGSGHAVTIIGYDDKKRAFKIINSWGRKWGNKGYLWISYSAVQSLVKGAYVMDTRPEKRNKPEPIPDPVPEPTPTPQVGNLEKAVKIVSNVDCAGIASFQQQPNKIKVFAKNQNDLQKLKSELALRLPSFEIDTNLAPWPQCEARITLGEQIKNSYGLQLAINDLSSDKAEPVLTEGDPLVLKMKTPSFPSYIYAAYLAQDKEGKHEVIHLIQTTDVLEQYPPNSEIIIGDGRNNTDEFTITGPNFGKEMIVLIASASPLYTKERAWTELDRDYLSGIRDALILKSASNGKRQIAAQFLTLTTRKNN